jgi:hypothetical protein
VPKTDVAWVMRFNGPIVAERGGVVEAVKASLISRPRLGRSRMTVGDAIVANLRERKIHLPPEILDEGWSAVRRDGYWEVTFRYLSRGQPREARFAYDLEKRSVRHLNALAAQLGWYVEGSSESSKARIAASPDGSQEPEVASGGRSGKESQEKKPVTASTVRRRPARGRRPASPSPASPSPASPSPASPSPASPSPAE